MTILTGFNKLCLLLLLFLIDNKRFHQPRSKDTQANNGLCWMHAQKFLKTNCRYNISMKSENIGGLLDFVI